MVNNTAQENILSELRRGVLVLAVLSQLDNEQYGYSLLTSLAESGLEIEQGTLYPLLRRLEAQGLLQSNWRLEEGRPRRYYTLNQQGRAVLAHLKMEWQSMAETMQKMLG